MRKSSICNANATVGTHAAGEERSGAYVCNKNTKEKTPINQNSLLGVFPWDASILNVQSYYATPQGKNQLREGISMISITLKRYFSNKEGIIYVERKWYP